MTVNNNELCGSISLNECFELCDAYMIQMDIDSTHVKLSWRYDGYVYHKMIDKMDIFNNTVPFSRIVEDFVKHCKSEYERVRNIDEWE